MKFTSKEQLDRFRIEAKERFDKEESEKIKIFVGMGTCGVAAGARRVLDAVNSELEKRKIDATVIQTGCIGMCVREPLVDVQLPGQARITYGNIKPSDVPRIIVGHVLYGNIIENLAVARYEEI